MYIYIYICIYYDYYYYIRARWNVNTEMKIYQKYTFERAVQLEAARYCKDTNYNINSQALPYTESYIWDVQNEIEQCDIK